MIVVVVAVVVEGVGATQNDTRNAFWKFRKWTVMGL